MTDIQAHLRFLPMSAQKVRLVVDLVRGKGANEALEMLRFVPKAAALPVRKLLASAVANAEENFGVSRDDLFVAKIFADEAPTRKWRRFGAPMKKDDPMLHCGFCGKVSKDWPERCEHVAEHLAARELTRDVWWPERKENHLW